MFSLLLTVCLMGNVCSQTMSSESYADLASCFAAAGPIAAETAKTPVYGWRADCSTETDLGIATVSTDGGVSLALAPDDQLAQTGE
jgi:hypothetical protein